MVVHRVPLTGTGAGELVEMSADSAHGAKSMHRREAVVTSLPLPTSSFSSF